MRFILVVINSITLKSLGTYIITKFFKIDYKISRIIIDLFVSITFIAGVYGMNFDNMPELHHKNGYYFTLGLMVLIVVITFIYTRRKKW